MFITVDVMSSFGIRYHGYGLIGVTPSWLWSSRRHTHTAMQCWNFGLFLVLRWSKRFCCNEIFALLFFYQRCSKKGQQNSLFSIKDKKTLCFPKRLTKLSVPKNGQQNSPSLPVAPSCPCDLQLAPSFLMVI